MSESILGESMEVAVPTAALTQLTRMAERIAALEARTSTEIGVLKDDVKVVRQMLHDARNQMQILVSAEERFSMTIKGQEEQLKKLILKVDSLFEDRTKAEGAWWMLTKVILVVGFTCSGIAAAVTVVWWGLNHISVRY